MVYSVRCRCGMALQVEQQYLSSALRCPSCHELLRLPTPGQPASLRKHLLAGLAALLLILGGVTLALFLGRRTDRDPPPVERPADSPPVAVVPRTPEVKPKARRHGKVSRTVATLLGRGMRSTGSAVRSLLPKGLFRHEPQRSLLTLL